MSEQYAFAIGFDALVSELSPQQESDWQRVLQEINQVIAAAGLSDLFSDRWDEFGHGRIFWGTQAECTAIQQILCQFPVDVQEERNLEAGYYAVGAEVYYVTAQGDIYGSAVENASASTVIPLSAIPLDAYRLRTVSTQIVNQFGGMHQGLLAESVGNAPQPPVETMAAILPLASEAELAESSVVPSALSLESIPLGIAMDHAEPGEADINDPIVSTFVGGLQTEINRLQEQIVSLSNELAQSQAIAAAKIDPVLFETQQQQYAAQQERYAQLEQQYAAQREQCAQLEQQVQTLETQWADIIPAETDGPSLETLKRELEQQQHQNHALAEQLQTMRNQSDRAIAREEYESIQQQLAQRNARVVELEQLLSRSEDEMVPLKAIQQSYEDLQIQFQRQETELEELKAQLETLATAHQRQQDEIAADLARQQEQKDALNQDALTKGTQVEALSRTVQALEQDVQKWEAIAAAKVDATEHHTVQGELTQLHRRLRHGIVGFLFGWLFR
jgi:predicted  nucleic acid-binding Zn-ribbon protein